MSDTSTEQGYVFKELGILEETLKNAKLPEDLRLKCLSSLERLNRMATFGGYSAEFEVTSHYISWVVSLPWYTASPDNLDLKKAREILDGTHYGMEKVKERMLEYLSVLSLLNQQKKQVSSSILCLIGMPGLGKTSIAQSIALALGRTFIRIAMGGLGSSSQLRGVPKTVVSAEPGDVIKGIRRAGTNNPVVLLDEIDRVSEEARADVMGVLLELLDPEQNNAFIDYYIDFPFDLSQALFICSGNNTGGIANAVLDRLEIIEMPSYTDEEKEAIGRNYLLPKALAESGLNDEQLMIDDEVWSAVIRPLGYDAGIRTLDRTIRGMTRKVARKIVEGEGTSFRIDMSNMKQYLPTW